MKALIELVTTLLKGLAILVAAFMLLAGVSGVLLGLFEAIKTQNSGEAIALLMMAGLASALAWAGLFLLRGLSSKGSLRTKLWPKILPPENSSLDIQQLSNNESVQTNEAIPNKGRFILLLVLAAIVGINVVLAALRMFL